MDKKNTSFNIATVAIVAALVVSTIAFKGVAIESAYPFERAAKVFSRCVWRPLTGLWDGVAARAENERLRREVESLSMVLADNAALYAENDSLRSLLGYRENLRGRWMAAKVLSFGGGAGATGRMARIDKGSSSGIVKGAVVCVPEGLVGKVVDVTAHTAEIALLPGGSVKVSCEIEGCRGVLGILSGGTDGSLVIDHVSGDAAIAPRSRVVTSGKGGVFPKGLVVGSFIEEIRPANGAPRSLRIEPAVAFSEIEDVFVRHEE